RTRILENEVCAGALELSGHLRRDHVHRLRLAQPAIAHETLEAEGARGVDEDDAVEARSHVLLEKERDVAHDDAVAALTCLVQQSQAQALDLGVNDLVQLLELLGIAV